MVVNAGNVLPSTEIIDIASTTMNTCGESRPKSYEVGCNLVQNAAHWLHRAEQQ
jgi:hypothetical protein